MLTYVVDQGNTHTKIAFYEGKVQLESAVLTDETLMNDLVALFERYHASTGLVSSVRADPAELLSFLDDIGEVHIFGPETKLFFPVDYETPRTLGSDRKANAAAAVSEYAEQDCLVLDCGTCLTYTLVLNGTLCGGAISPGLNMRFKALSHYTGRLPEVLHRPALPPILGKSTEESIRAGVELAIVLETDNMIGQYCSRFGDLIVLLTGGAMPFFVQQLKSTIFARPNLTLTGLNEILL